MAVVQLLSDLPEVRQVHADIMPGPPPNFDSSLVVNVEPTRRFVDVAASEILSKSRSLCLRVLMNLDAAMIAQAKVVAISVVESPADGPVRVYSVSVDASEIGGIHNEDALRRRSSNEFSMLEDVEKLIR